LWYQTSTALNRIIASVSVFDAVGRDEYSNGNSALMRVLPVALFERENIETLIEMAMKQCITTHEHPRSAIVCAFYRLMANHLIKKTLMGAAKDLDFCSILTARF
jgi:ADP-ribosyl-[dinitrogen reductase] hydrolase